MAGERFKLDVSERDARGSAESRRLRARGLVPGVLYGSGRSPHPFCVPERNLRRALTGGHGLHAILDVVFDGQKTPHHAVLKEYQLDPTRARLLHIDLHEVRLDRPIQAQVVVELVGESEGMAEGGVLTQVAREVNVEALPMDVPEHLALDISSMAVGDSMRVADLRVPADVTLLDDPDTVLATVTPPTRVELPEEMVEEEEAEAVEGELPEDELPEGGTEQPAEPGGDAAGEEQTAEG